MTNLQFSMEILYIYDSVFLDARMIFNIKIYYVLLHINIL